MILSLKGLKMVGDTTNLPMRSRETLHFQHTEQGSLHHRRLAKHICLEKQHSLKDTQQGLIREDGKSGYLTRMTGPQRGACTMMRQAGSLMINCFHLVTCGQQDFLDVVATVCTGFLIQEIKEKT